MQPDAVQVSLDYNLVLVRIARALVGMMGTPDEPIWGTAPLALPRHLLHSVPAPTPNVSNALFMKENHTSKFQERERIPSGTRRMSYKKALNDFLAIWELANAGVGACGVSLGSPLCLGLGLAMAGPGRPFDPPD